MVLPARRSGRDQNRANVAAFIVCHLCSTTPPDGTVTISSASRVNSTTTTTPMYPAMTKVTGTTATQPVGDRVEPFPQVDRMFHNRDLAVEPVGDDDDTENPQGQRKGPTPVPRPMLGMSAIRAREIALGSVQNLSSARSRSDPS